jgi:hypothetical protein
MPTSPSAEIQIWLPAIATIVSGVVAAVVAIGVTWLGHKFTLRREVTKFANEQAVARKAFLREKLEALVAHAGEHITYLNSHSDHIATLGVHSANGSTAPDENHSPDGAVALDKARAIVTLYFPSLAPILDEIDATTLAHLRFTSEEISVIAADAAGWSKNQAKTYSTRSVNILGEVMRANKKLSQAARRMIETELAP